MVCWGFNGTGQLGNGATSTTPTPVPVPVQGITDARAVVAGNGFTCALVGGGAVWCWGTDVDGQVGGDTYAAEPVTSPVQAKVSGVTVHDAKSDGVLIEDRCERAAHRSLLAPHLDSRRLQGPKVEPILPRRLLENVLWACP